MTIIHTEILAWNRITTTNLDVINYAHHSYLISRFFRRCFQPKELGFNMCIQSGFAHKIQIHARLMIDHDGDDSTWYRNPMGGVLPTPTRVRDHPLTIRETRSPNDTRMSYATCGASPYRTCMCTLDNAQTIYYEFRLIICKRAHSPAWIFTRHSH